MSKYRFIYIDDENDATTEAIADGLKVGDLLDIVSVEPKDFKQQKLDFEQHLKEFDGIILDLRLDGKRLDIPYNAPALAQELRMMAIEGVLKSRPIILCSTEEKMRATYDVDKTSHDLFDYKFHKQPAPPWEKFATKIYSLAHGYNLIQQNFDLKSILQRDDFSALDSRVFERFNGLEKHLPVFDYAAFVVKGLFHQPGPLVKENLMAARLGVDIPKSGNAWKKLRDDIFKDALYKGVFSEGWSRWWSDMVLTIFKKMTDKRLAILNAAERVDLLIKVTGIAGLVAAQPLEYAKSTNYWTICEFYKMPLDPLEGFMVHSSIEPKSWQENRYISLDAVLKKKGPRPHSSEMDRINLIKETFDKK